MSKKSKVVATVDIDDHFKMEIDELNYTLFKRVVSKEGNESWSRIGYYSSPEMALWSLVGRELASSRAHLDSIDAFTREFVRLAEKYHLPNVMRRAKDQLDKLLQSREEKKVEERKRQKAKLEAKKSKNSATAKPKPKSKPKPKPKPKKKRQPAV